MKLSTIVLTGALVTLPAGATQGITDPQIAHIVVTANQVDIDAGELARKNATDPEVKKFAERMVTDHTGVNKSAAELAKKLGVTPQDNETSRALKTGGDENVEKLRGLSWAAFDRAYMAHEVAYHTQVLKALDETLIPGAQNAELKALLVKVRPAFVAHLEHAKKIHSSLERR